MQSSSNMLGYIGIAATIFLGVYSQVVIKWQVTVAGQLPTDPTDKALFLLNMLLRPWVISALAATLVGGLTWMIALSKFDVSYAYPFMALVYAIMIAAGIFVFNEPYNHGKVIGVLIIMLGIFIVGRYSS